MKSLVSLAQAVAQTIQEIGPAAGQVAGPVGPPPAGEHGFSYRDAFFELVQFVGYFLAIGAVGFRYGVVRRAREMSDVAKQMLRAENASLLGIIGVLLLYVSFLGGPFVSSIVEHKTFAESLPRNLNPFEFKMGMLGLALVGFSIVRAAPAVGWALAAVGIFVAVLQPVYTGRGAGKFNAVHVFAASTWIGTLLVLTIVGIRGVIRRGTSGTTRAELVCDLVNAFSPLALSAATVVALSGLTTAWLHLKRISALWTTSYGITLIVKLCLVACVVSLGAWNWKRVRPSLGESGSENTIRRSSRMELTFAGLVLLATSVLVTLPSPR
jgi:uncharacterized membrane protein